jgi:hypothetical protein
MFSVMNGGLQWADELDVDDESSIAQDGRRPPWLSTHHDVGILDTGNG